MNSQPINCKTIEKALTYKYHNAKYMVNNVYFFGGGYFETDFLVVQQSGLIFDIEIKISKSDFLADFKKTEKHLLLSGNKKQEYIPNKFYYAVPEGLIPVGLIPDYAGLLYIKGINVTEIKPAPLLHKNKLEYRTRLADKFYYSYRELIAYKEKDNIYALKKEISDLKKQLETSMKNERDTYLELIKLKRHGKTTP